MKSHPPERQYDTILHLFHALPFDTAQLQSLFMHSSTVVTSATEYYLIHRNLRLYRLTATDHLVHKAAKQNRP